MQRVRTENTQLRLAERRIAMDETQKVYWIDMDTRERNTLVAKEVMGYTISRFKFEHDGVVEDCVVWVDPNGYVHNPKPYSTNIKFAWELVDELWKYDLRICLDEDLDHVDYSKGIKSKVSYAKYWGGQHIGHVGNSCARTVSEAICLASLRAMGLDVVTCH